MSSENKYTFAIIKTIFTYLTLLGLFLAGIIVYSIIKEISITNTILKFNNMLFYFNNLIVIVLLGLIFLVSARIESKSII